MADDDESYLDTPNCESCLVRMEPDGEDLVAWKCPQCGAVTGG